MTFKGRFILLAIFNCGLLLGFYFLFSTSTIELSKRLIDLSITDVSDRQAFFVFISFMLVAFLGNFIFLSSSRSELTTTEVEEIVKLLKA